MRRAPAEQLQVGGGAERGRGLQPALQDLRRLCSAAFAVAADDSNSFSIIMDCRGRYDVCSPRSRISGGDARRERRVGMRLGGWEVGSEASVLAGRERGAPEGEIQSVRERCGGKKLCTKLRLPLQL